MIVAIVQFLHRKKGLVVFICSTSEEVQRQRKRFVSPTEINARRSSTRRCRREHRRHSDEREELAKQPLNSTKGEFMELESNERTNQVEKQRVTCDQREKKKFQIEAKSIEIKRRSMKYIHSGRTRSRLVRRREVSLEHVVEEGSLLF